MAFSADIRQWKTPAALAASLQTLPRPDWSGEGNPRGSTFHNTYRPLASQWAGKKSMESMRDGYIGKGWTAGPHFYLVLGAPNSAHDGIWQMTPPTVPGVHAGDCNGRRFGIEVVGDFQLHAPPAPLQDLLIDVLTVLHRWAGIGPDLVAHRDCMAGRTCPGDAFYQIKPDLVQRLSAALAPPPPPPPTGAITADSPLVAPARCTEDQAVRFMLSRPHGEYVESDIRNVIIPAYFHLGRQSGVDPCIALAQLIHETGNLTSFWSARPRRNPAGIGVTGQVSKTRPPAGVEGWSWDDAAGLWRLGVSFPTWASHSIPAHMGRLLAYAVKPEQRTQAQQGLVALALSYRALPAQYHGAAPTLKGLNGRWAFPGGGYATKLAAIAEAMRTL